MVVFRIIQSFQVRNPHPRIILVPADFANPDFAATAASWIRQRIQCNICAYCALLGESIFIVLPDLLADVSAFAAVLCPHPVKGDAGHQQRSEPKR